MKQLHCPACGLPLDRKESIRGNHWECPRCSGKAATTVFLRKLAGPEAISNLWLRARVVEVTGNRECPACMKMMKEVSLDSDQGRVDLDVCTACSMVWFDCLEFEKTIREQDLPEHGEMTRQGDHEPGELPMVARRMLAEQQVKAIARQSRQRDMYDFNQPPDHWWQWILAFLGVPVEQNGPCLKKIPVATWSLVAVIVALNAGLFFQEQEFIEKVYQQWGLIPGQFFRYGGLTLISSFFLHGDPLHLIGNMYFLLVVGDNVEDCLGIGRFFLLLFCATLLGDVLHSAFMYDSTLPCIGASGGISGLIIFYAFRFPRARFAFMIWLYVRIFWIRIPVFLWALYWVGVQFVLTYMQMKGVSNISALGHLGGAATGLGFFLFYRYYSSFPVEGEAS